VQLKSMLPLTLVCRYRHSIQVFVTKVDPACRSAVVQRWGELEGGRSPSPLKDSDVEEADVFGVFGDEVFTLLDVVTHEHAGDFVGECGLLDGDLQQGSA
jgi:hypothetical protein